MTTLEIQSLYISLIICQVIDALDELKSVKSSSFFIDIFEYPTKLFSFINNYTVLEDYSTFGGLAVIPGSNYFSRWIGLKSTSL